MGRHRRHLPQVLAALCGDVAAHSPGHLLVTGDLVNIALPAEFAAARRWLESLGTPADVTVVPGNHDATVRLGWTAGLGRWAPWMTGDGDEAGGSAANDATDRFPVVRRRGSIGFVNLSSAVPTAPLLACGRLGRAQVERAAVALDRLRRDGLFRVVAIHP